MRVVASWLAAAALAPVALAGAASAPPATVLGVTFAGGTSQLLRVDALTLQPTASATVPIPGVYGQTLRSPDGAQLVLAANGAPKLSFVDLERMQALATMTPTKAGTIQLIAWPEPQRLYAFGWGCCPARTDVLVIDPAARTVLARVPLNGTEVSEAASADGVAVLTSPLKGIGAARLVDVSRDGSARRLTLSRIKAGSKWRTVNFQPVGTVRQPGFAADSTGRHAYVIDAGGLVADVDVTTFAVSYTTARSFARAEKAFTGPMRHARWIGGGRIAITGINAQRRKTRTGWQDVWAPAGLRIIDTSTWSSQTVDAKASWFVTAPGSVLVVAGGYMSAYDLDGGARFRLPVKTAQAYVDVHGRYAYVWDGNTVSVVDAATGSVAATVPKPDLWLVPGDA